MYNQEMKDNEGYIYSETDLQLIEGPFNIHHNKWCRSLEKRATAIRRFFFRNSGRIRERIVSYALTIAAMAKLKAGSRVADLGGASSLLGLYLVYLGHEVHVLDLRPYPLKHPRLFSKQIDIFNNNLPDNYFHAICCISVIEHVGLDRYGGLEQNDGDLKMAKEIQRLVRPNGLVILSTPYGKPHDPALNGKPKGYRIYDRSRLGKLLQGFKVKSLRFFVMVNGCWVEEDQRIADNVPVKRPIDAKFLALLHVSKSG